MSSLAYLLLCAIATTPLVAAQCERSMLEEAAAQYVTAQTSGQISDLTYLADTVEHTENFQPVDIATGLLATALKVDNSRSLLDTTSCATYTELIITDPAHPYVIGAQMRFTDNQITQIDRIITDEGDWLFDAASTLQYAQGENWDPIPEDQRDSREVIQAGGDAYLDLFNDASVQVPWGEPCARLEGGMYTGTGSPTDSCNVGVPSGLDLTNRRYVIDEVMGTVDVFLNFGGATGLPDSHEFRLEGGKLRYVHTMTIMA
ncbi:hypothetical protein FQN52_005331 [Onygenales sp. PD_12]|nr:hypothetical protein FQN52_005331 [Onygenales sp. PD_12]KAK2796336.1 hypothetical protein FQN51_009426 [Onygenales sp. PD_10]